MSVFTFDPNPPRVSSPWLKAADTTPPGSEDSSIVPRSSLHNSTATHSALSEYDMTKLPPEPQEGPVEYKLHLLLRPRRSYKSIHAGSPKLGAFIDPKHMQKTRVVASTTASQTRQDRCQHLTTQLLWRLRQSSPYHASVAHQDIDFPRLPDDAAIVSNPISLGKLAPGLEESRGALYEIGVADDGTLVGITEEELEQSIATLRWMAANLGCTSEVLRRVAVGECEWTEKHRSSDGGPLPTSTPSSVSEADTNEKTCRDKLWVAEVFVKPHMDSTDTESRLPRASNAHPETGGSDPADVSTTLGSATKNQLRVTLTGPTGSGKSTLLGTLSTGAFDDGHGKGRLNSLKHLHEMESGLTSTVTQELVGYDEDSIVNYANPNIESWVGIHDYTKDGRLVFISDSAGHPRYRRTTLRGLVGWAPHWTVLCLGAANDNSSTLATEQIAGPRTRFAANSSAGSAALGKAHLDLCLKLGVPLAIIITKSDLLNKESLKRALVPIWTAVKRAGRVPQLLQSKQRSFEFAREITLLDEELIERALSQVKETGNFRATVPVILASTVSGDGIGLVHALLNALPLPATPSPQDYIGMALNPEQPEALFHIEDKFSRPASYASVAPGQLSDPGYVFSGYLRFGKLSVGDRVVVGPFPSEEDASGFSLDDETGSPSHHSYATSHPSASELSRIVAKNAVSASVLKGEWHTARIVSIRNLRMPVQTLEADQVGTVGLVIEPTEQSQANNSFFESRPPRALKPRRGMVLAIPSQHMRDSGLQLQAASGLTAFFSDVSIESLGVGTIVTFYIASIRAQARIAKIWSGAIGEEFLEGTTEDGTGGDGPEDDVFGLHESTHDHKQHATAPAQGYNVRLELLFGREWVELGSQIVILEGASREQFLLDGFVGRVVEIVD